MHRKVSYHSNTVVIFSYQCLNSLKSPCKLLGDIYYFLKSPFCLTRSFPNIPEVNRNHSWYANEAEYTRGAFGTASARLPVGSETIG